PRPASPPATSGRLSVELTSQPYPLTVGTNTLRIRLSGPDGAALVDAASVRVDSLAVHDGAMPLSRPAARVAEGIYEAAQTYPMPGEYDIDITAELANGETLREHYDVFVYPIPPDNRNPRTTFLSASE